MSVAFTRGDFSLGVGAKNYIHLSRPDLFHTRFNVNLCFWREV